MPANAFIDRNQENERVGCTFIKESGRCQSLTRMRLSAFAPPAQLGEKKPQIPPLRSPEFSVELVGSASFMRLSDKKQVLD
jgi:hypothetical protein